MPPVSLPWNGGTVSAQTGPHASIPHTATKLAAPIIRIADSISSLVDTLKRIRRHGKNGGRQDAELSPTVAALHLTSSGLHGTVCTLDHCFDHLADCPCATSSAP